jgi:hypothetical protein
LREGCEEGSPRGEAEASGKKINPPAGSCPGGLLLLGLLLASARSLLFVARGLLALLNCRPFLNAGARLNPPDGLVEVGHIIHPKSHRTLS